VPQFAGLKDPSLGFLGLFLEPVFIPGELLYLEAVSDSFQALPDPGKLAHDLKVLSFDSPKTPPGALEITPIFDRPPGGSPIY